ncbi:sensor histidine kinase [Pseudomonas jinjuensis]|uniref:histidine kinase n=1 Tax=Pseudomonas jinjuensis TaxID=198616 RepID=A0A1H0NYQ5_9PSED|nr:ATP-binding protein [Pseudomonas jinjuensis]SDO97814.1 two-component system, OmpR family, sensor histidine kinase QseC [Pseudomonas jinjuensis]
MTSLRRRTLWMVMLSLLAGTGLLALFTYHDSSHEVAEIYDAHLAQNARLLQGVMHMPLAGGDRRALYAAFNEALSHASRQSVGHPYESKLAFQVWNADGASVVRSASAPPFAAPLRTPGFANVEAAGRHWRGFLLPDEQQRLLIWVGERSDVREDLLQRIVRHTLLPYLVGSLGLAALVGWAIGWGLRPLQNMARVIRARHAESLEPLRLTPLPRELEPMQAAINRLLAQIDALLQREHRFIADAAHEMRTPLAVLRLHAQNALHAADPAQRREALEFLIGGVDRLARVVNQLLTLARVEPELARRNWQPLDLEKVVRETLAELTPWIFGKGLEVSLDVAPGRYPMRSDASAIGIALQNLVTNAAHFSPAGGEIRVGLEHRDGRFVLTVEDQGPGIDEERLGRLFERFYSQDNPHGAGLGLAIVEMIARRLGGHVSLANRDGGGLRATLLLPCDTPDAAAGETATIL